MCIKCDTSKLYAEEDPNDLAILRHLVIEGIPDAENEEQKILSFFDENGASTKVMVNKQDHRALVLFTIYEVRGILTAIKAIRRQGKNVYVVFPPWSTKANPKCSGHQLILDGLPPLARANEVRGLLGRFGASTKVEVDERMHRALVTFPTEETLYRIWSAEPLCFRDSTLLAYVPETYKWSPKTTSRDKKMGKQMIFSHLPPMTTENDIRNLFGRFGAFIKVKVDESMHEALATFSSPETLSKIMASVDLCLNGVTIRTHGPGNYE